jgi:integrase
MTGPKDKPNTELEAICKTLRGVTLQNGKIRINFTYRGVPCRPILRGLEVTKKNLKWAEKKRNVVLFEIDSGAFNYNSHFPNDARASLFSKSDTPKTISQGLKAFFNLKATKLAPKTLSSYKSKSKHIEVAFGPMQINMLKNSQIEHWISNELAYLANKTIKEILIPLRGVMKAACKDDPTFINPCDNLDELKLLYPEVNPFTLKEMTRLFETPTWRIHEINMMQTACWTGLSVSEYIAVGWEDLDTTDWTLRVRRNRVEGVWKYTKTAGRTRTIEIMPAAREALMRQKANTFLLPPIDIRVLQADNKTYLWEKLSPIFLNSATGKPFLGDQPVRDLFFRDHCKRAGVAYRAPNNCRHTFASQMLTLGLSKEWLKHQLGHRTTAMIDRYYGRWIREDALNMADEVAKRLIWDAPRDIDLIPRFQLTETHRKS